MLISPAYAQGLSGDNQAMLMNVLPFVLIFVVFYFLLIRPQQQRAKEQKATLAALRRGDRIVTGGGMIGTIAKIVSDEEVLVDIAEGTRVRILRATIASVMARTEPVTGKDTPEAEGAPEDGTAVKDKRRSSTRGVSGK